jgi:hypothetical protein
MKISDGWFMQYYCNGVNLSDLIHLRWDKMVGNCFVIQRQKTKNTNSSRPVFSRPSKSLFRRFVKVGVLCP